MTGKAHAVIGAEIGLAVAVHEQVVGALVVGGVLLGAGVALLPDIDTQKSLAGRWVPKASFVAGAVVAWMLVHATGLSITAQAAAIVGAGLVAFVVIPKWRDTWGHRGPTHSPIAALVATALAALLCWRVAPGFVWPLAFLVGACYTSHLLADALASLAHFDQGTIPARVIEALTVVLIAGAIGRQSGWF